MQFFLVLFDPEMASDIEERSSNVNFETRSISENAILLATTIDDPLVVRNLLGFGKGKGKEVDSLGAVFKLNGSYSGYYYEGLWDWIEKIREGHLSVV